MSFACDGIQRCIQRCIHQTTGHRVDTSSSTSAHEVAAVPCAKAYALKASIQKLMSANSQCEYIYMVKSKTCIPMKLYAPDKYIAHATLLPRRQRHPSSSWQQPRATTVATWRWRRGHPLMGQDGGSVSLSATAYVPTIL
jgi:hypothetical protein